jgi:endonuclease/exonuclease/phosphatase family metal-dependent hydrolase
MKFISLNLWPVGELFDRIVDFLDQEQADLLFLQEVYNGTDSAIPLKFRAFEELKKHLKLPYGEFAPTFFDVDVPGAERVDQGNAVLSRFPLQSREPIFYDVPYGERQNTPAGFPFNPRNLQRVTAEIHGQTVYLFNTQGIWGLDGGDTDRRLQMSQKIVNEIKDVSPVILAGDFNVKPNTQTIYNIEKHLQNVFKDELVTSFNMNWKTNPGYATAVVDMVFVSPTIRVTSHHCPQLDISDHLPLVCELELV